MKIEGTKGNEKQFLICALSLPYRVGGLDKAQQGGSSSRWVCAHVK